MRTLFTDHYYVLLVAYFVAITILCAAAAYVFLRLWNKDNPNRRFLVNTSISIFSTLYILLIFEALFAYCFVQSDGFGFTLAARQWFNKYWHPINSYGYRDYEPSWADKTVFVVGDSFVAGHGIKKVDSRFSNILANKLDENWSVTTLAKNGWNPGNYLNALKTHDKKPDVIIISYFINDIESAAAGKGAQMPSFENKPNKYIRQFTNYSYLANWIYWRIYRGSVGSNTYWHYLKQSYSDKDIWNAHLLELDALISYADEVDARIGFLIWPNLRDVNGSKVITNKVSEYLVNKGITVLNLTKHYENRSVSELIVNSLDAHPNERVNAEVAKLLYDEFAPWH